MAFLARELWREYGLTVLTVWGIETDLFERFVGEIQEERSRAEREARESR